MVRKIFNLVTFNVRSLVDRSRRIELDSLLKRFKVDIAFVQELHLRNDKSVRLDNFSVITDKSSLGVGIVFRSSLSFVEIKIPGVNFPNIFVRISVTIDGEDRNIILGSIYFPSNFNRQEMTNGLSKILDFSGNFDGLILGGDLNAKNVTWGDVDDNYNGVVLADWVRNESLSVTRVCDSYPTFPGGSSHLDHFILSNNLIDNLNINYNTSTLPTFSDHLPLGIKISLSDFRFLFKTPEQAISFKDTNWNLFRNDLCESIHEHFPPKNRNLSDQDIDNYIQEFETSVNFVTSIHSRKIDLRNKKFTVSEKVKRLLKIKYDWQKDLKTIYYRTLNRRHPDYLLISKQIDLLKIIIKEQIDIDQAKLFNDKLREIKPGTTAYKDIFRIIGRKNSSALKDLSVNDIEIQGTDQKLEHLRLHFQSVYTGSPPDGDVSGIQEDIHRFTSQIPGSLLSFNEDINSSNTQNDPTFTSRDDIRQVTKSLNNKRSGGIDKISNFLIRKMPMDAFEYLAIIFNNCINNGYFPNSWKISKIVPVRKQKGNNDINFLRPISLLPNIGKLFERIIKRKMDGSITEKFIPECQFGFKRGNSTVHALLKFHTDVVQNLRNRKCTVAISLDVEKAFDKAYHDGILFKLISIGFTPSIVRLIQSFFKNRKFCVSLDGCISSLGDVTCGVPQGSILAPHLYNIFIHDFPHQFGESKGILYADDSLIYAHDESPVNALRTVSSHLRHVKTYYSKWGIKINASKSKALCLRNASGKCKRFVVPQSKILKLYLDGNEIKFENNFKYLGIHFDKLLKFNNHARYSLKKANGMKGALSCLFGNKYLPIETKLLLYKVSIRPILLYAFPIWFSISPTIMKQMEIFERGVIRKCIGKNFECRNRRFSNHYIYESSSLSPLSDYALGLMHKFIVGLELFDGNVMRDILASEDSFSWSNTNYLSAIGILWEQLDIPGRNFYSNTTPGIHRG